MNPALPAPREAWELQGFESREAFLDHLERSQNRWFGDPISVRNEARALMGLEPLAEEDVPASPLRTEPRYRQVGIKLSPASYAGLAEAAERFGVAPTTLAGVLLGRAVAAVLSSEREPRRGSRRNGSAP